MTDSIIENEIILDSEDLFKIKLLEEIGVNWLMIKSQNQMCPLDFLCVNKNNIKTLHLEHKRRSGNECVFNTLYIGYDKVNKIEEHYKKCIYIWEYDNMFYWVKHRKDFLNKRTGYCRGKKVYHIEKEICNLGFDSLVSYINSLSNDRF